jgi:hypothetical protein
MVRRTADPEGLTPEPFAAALAFMGRGAVAPPSLTEPWSRVPGPNTFRPGDLSKIKSQGISMHDRWWRKGLVGLSVFLTAPIALAWWVMLSLGAVRLVGAIF